MATHYTCAWCLGRWYERLRFLTCARVKDILLRLAGLRKTKRISQHMSTEHIAPFRQMLWPSGLGWNMLEC